jgi:hypothetical protein
MDLGKILWTLLLSLFLLSACEDKKDNFSGLSDLVEQRNTVRKNIADKNIREKAVKNQGSGMDSKEAAALDREPKKNPEISPIVLYEREVEVVDSSSRKALAKGIAYLNKQGQIVKIRIVRD